MATITYIKETRQRPSDMRRVMEYCMQEKKTWDEEVGIRYVSGVNCDGLNSITEFEATKAAWDKEDGIRFYQYVQSFSPEENITHKQAHELALEFAAKAWPGHEVLVATHCDTDHIHSHFIINSVSFETGLKLRQHPTTLVELRKLSDELCKAHGFSTLERYEKGGQKVAAREYRAAVKGDSWKFQLMYHIGEAMKRSTSKEDFIRQMKKRGYGVTWTNERKHITYTCPNGMKCRGSKLHEEKYEKEMMELEFAIRAKQAEECVAVAIGTAQRPGFGDKTADSIPAHRLRTPGRMAGEGGTDAGGRGAVPAEAVSADWESGNDRKLGEHAGAAAGCDSTGTHRPGEPIDPNTATGWEDERAVFLGLVQAAIRQHPETGGHQRNDAPQVSKLDPHYGNRVGAVFDAGLRFVSAFERMTEDTEEDEEERRKRIQAQQGGQALGTALGVAISALLAMQEPQNEEEMYEQEERDIWQLSM